MNVWPNEEIFLFNSHLHGYVYTYRPKCIIYNKMHKYVNSNYVHNVYHTNFLYVHYVILTCTLCILNIVCTHCYIIYIHCVYVCVSAGVCVLFVCVRACVRASKRVVRASILVSGCVCIDMCMYALTIRSNQLN